MVWCPLSTKPDPELRDNRISAFEWLVLIVSASVRGFSTSILAKILPGIGGCLKSRRQDSRTVPVRSLAPRFSSYDAYRRRGRFGFDLRFWRMSQASAWRMPAERLMRSALVVGVAQQVERRL